MTKPTIGRVVHFYNNALKDSQLSSGGVALNSQGAGPYAATVIQCFDGPFVNLSVHAWGGDWREGSVSEKADNNSDRYWIWPPRE